MQILKTARCLEETPMTDDEMRYIDQRLTNLDIKFEERWKAHEKRFDEIYFEIRTSLKDLILKLQIMQDRFLSQHETCMNEVDHKLRDTEKKCEKKNEDTEKKFEKGVGETEKKMWKLVTIMIIAIPTLFYVISQVAIFFITAAKS
jgi:t-SNARE complex subunit (syntaxin)